MKTFTRVSSIALIAFATLAGCGGGGGGGGGVTTPPPPVADQSPSGLWDGQAVTAAGPDVFTSFEFNDTGGFSTGTSPFTATFSSGNAETRGVQAFYISGLNAWHILNGTSATVTFETPPRTLSFWARTAFAADVSSIQIFDTTPVTPVLIMTVTPTNAYGSQATTVTRTSAETAIGSMVVTSTTGGGGGDVVIDDLTFGYLGTTDDISCLIAETLEFACAVTDATTDALLAGAQGTVQVTGTTVTGSGTLVAAPGTTLDDGSTVATLAISAGTVNENTSLNLTIAAAGVSTTVSTTFEASYNRNSDLATVAGVYPTFELFGDPASFVVAANGGITSQSNSGCVGNGQIDIIDAGFNAYDVTFDVTNCGALNGMYNGLGLTGDVNATDDAFAFAVFTAQSVILGEAAK